jgi:glycine betaine catabolism B
MVIPVEDKTFFIVGPSQMHDLCEEALSSLGVPRNRVKEELCGQIADITCAPGWPGISENEEYEVMEEKSGRTFKAYAREPLMISMEKAGLVVPAVCRVGECSACRTKLVTGNVYVPDNVHRRWIDEKSGFIHPCTTYPIANIKIRMIG